MSELGTKRTCPSCGAKFYDLGKVPVTCPKCSKSFDPTALSSGRASKLKAKGKVKTSAKESKNFQHLDETGEDIDLSAFEDAEDLGSSVDEIESMDELDEDLDALAEVGEREREEDILNSDDAEDDAFIEEMDEVETLVDHPDIEEEDEEDIEKE